MPGILGKKIGMTQVFSDEGKIVGVTAIEAGPCSVLAVFEKSVQLGFDSTGEKQVKQPQRGYFKKLNLGLKKFIREVPRDAGKEYKVGEELKADVFKTGDYVDVSGISLGKGFQGGMKRWNWHGGGQTHGSMSHRRVGSIGSTTTPGRVWKGHHLPGHMGHCRVTLQNLLVVKADPQNNVLLVKGAVPGHKNCYLIVRTAKKRKPAPPKEKTAQSAKKGAKH
jgi:large subunit ribosomal protein L3